MSEGKDISQLTPSDKKLTRRQFLKLAGIGFATTLAGCTVEKVVNSQATSTSSPEPVFQTPHQLPDAPPASVSLKQTATALEITGQQSSFREEAGYTEEMFESVRRGTFIIEAIGERDLGVKETITNVGTGWLAQSENDTYYVVTNRHATQFPEGVKTTGVKLWRPSLDNEKFIPTNITIATTGGPDIAVLKLQGKYNTANPIETIRWEDNVLLQKGDKALVVGFPGEFRGRESELDSRTLGSVITIEKNADFQTGEWFARALINGGSSGSPTVINKDGQAIAVGIIFGRNDYVLKNSDTETQKQPVMIGVSLSIRDLINATNKN